MTARPSRDPFYIPLPLVTTRPAAELVMIVTGSFEAQRQALAIALYFEQLRDPRPR